MFPFLYRSFLSPALRGVMRAAALGSAKGGRGAEGRRRWREQLEGLRVRATGEPRVHFHAASVGEFEQAKPIIEALRGAYDRIAITASFFSPSGYEQQGSYAELDAACYLPADAPAEMRAFLDAVDPDLIVIIRYDLWPGLLMEARRRSIPVVLACGVLRSDSARFNPIIRPFFAWLYGMLSLAHMVGEDDRIALQTLAPHVPAEVSGDTRYDRVLARAATVRAGETPGLEAFTPELVADRTILVAGSTWPPDEALLAPMIDRDDLLMVIVPHEPTPEHVAALLDRLPGGVALSRLRERGDERIGAVVVDRTGILSALYAIGSIAYVGGAFGEGVHSVLEPAAYGVPVVSGPRIERSRDAEEMARLGLLRVIRTAEDLRDCLTGYLDRPADRERVGGEAERFVVSRGGATGSIVRSVRERRLLPAGGR